MTKDLERNVLVVGGGGHAKVVIEVLRACSWNPVGILDPQPPRMHVLGVPVLGGDDAAEAVFADGIRNAFVAVGENKLRRTLADRLRQIGFHLITTVHPSAFVAPSANIGGGVIVMPMAVVNSGAQVCDLVIVNTGAIIEHDCLVGEASHVAPRSVMGGQVILGEEVFFGIGATARPLSIVRDRAIIGAGALVIGQVPEATTMIGVPARPSKQAYPS